MAHRTSACLRASPRRLAPRRSLLDDDSGCSDKEKDFMTKWKAKDKAEAVAQLERLNKMVGGTMAADLKKWVAQRVNILKQITA